jgi:hypothetical protein
MPPSAASAAGAPRCRSGQAGARPCELRAKERWIARPSELFNGNSAADRAHACAARTPERSIPAGRGAFARRIPIELARLVDLVSLAEPLDTKSCSLCQARFLVQFKIHLQPPDSPDPVSSRNECGGRWTTAVFHSDVGKDCRAGELILETKICTRPSPSTVTGRHSADAWNSPTSMPPLQGGS